MEVGVDDTGLQGSNPRWCFHCKLCVYIKRCALRPRLRLVRDLWPEISGSQQCSKDIYAHRMQREGYRVPIVAAFNASETSVSRFMAPVNHPHRNICIIYIIYYRAM